MKEKQICEKKKMLLPTPKSLLNLTILGQGKGQLMLCEWQSKSIFHTYL